MEQDNNPKNENKLPGQELGHETGKNSGMLSNDDAQTWVSQNMNVVYYILGIVEALLLFRLLFRVLGANPANSFVSFLYSLTRNLIAPFSGIFGIYETGTVGQYILEPATIIAMVVYAVLARGIVGMIRLRHPNKI